jgi:hypothetical protein
MPQVLLALVRLAIRSLTMCWNAPIYIISAQIFTFYYYVVSVRAPIAAVDISIDPASE